MLAELLGYRLVDEELPRLIAARLAVSADFVETIENRAPDFGQRLLAGLGGAVPEVTQPAALPDDDIRAAYRQEVESLVRAAAREGDRIILGRLGSAILGERPDVLRVFVHAPLAWRIANVQTSLNCSAGVARAEIGRIDEARRAYAREAYRMVWGDVHNYDLAVNTARYGIDGAAAVIAAAARAAQPAR